MEKQHNPHHHIRIKTTKCIGISKQKDSDFQQGKDPYCIGIRKEFFRGYAKQQDIDRARIDEKKEVKHFYAFGVSSYNSTEDGVPVFRGGIRKGLGWIHDPASSTIDIVFAQEPPNPTLKMRYRYENNETVNSEVGASESVKNEEETRMLNRENIVASAQKVHRFWSHMFHDFGSRYVKCVGGMTSHMGKQLVHIPRTLKDAWFPGSGSN